MLACVFFLSANAEKAENKATENTIVVKGLVRDAHTKQPINAAQITVLNKRASATTDGKGIFKLNISSANDKLVVSAYDYSIREISVQGRDSVVIDLYPDVFSNYYKKIEGLTGVVENSTLVPSAKSVTEFNQPVAVSADELLQTEMGGDVRAISRSGLAGIGTSVFIRGLNSLNTNSQPLFVVDGVIWNNLYDVQSIHGGFFSNPLDDIDVSDIESITVVKDGTSIYGSKAANGVVLIKTKRGTGMVTKINVNAFTGTTTIPTTIPVMNASQFRIYESDMLGTMGLSNDDISKYLFLQDDATKTTYNNYHNNTNWADQIYQKGTTQSYSISANGGDEKALYYFSLGYTGTTGVVKTTDLQRINSRFNADFNLSKFFTMGLNIGFSDIDRKLLDDGVNNYTSPTWLSLIKAPFLSPTKFTATGSKSTDISYTDELGIGNPVGIIDYSSNTLKQYTFNISAIPTFHFSPNLTLSSQFDYNLNKSTEDYYSPMYYVAEKKLEGYGYVENTRMNQVMRNTSIFDDTRLNFSKQLNKDNHLNVLLGWRFLNNYYESDYIEGHNSGSNSSTSLPGSFDTFYSQVSGLNNLTRSLSNYLNVDYNFDNRYFLSAATSIDGSSRFGNETKGSFSLFGHSWGVFPSVNGAWLTSSEKFMKNFNSISHLKVRAGYGVTGNDDIEDYKTMTYFTTVRYAGNANGIILSNLENPQIQWETTKRANAGVDLGLFKDRLTLSFDYYSGITQNLLTLKTLPNVSGLASYWSNDGELSNKGFEFSANAKVLNFKSLKWEIGVSAGHYINKILSLPENIQIEGLAPGDYTTSVYGGEVLTSVGQPAGLFYGYKTNGVYATEAEAASASSKGGYLKIQNSNGTTTNFGAGDIRFVDTNNDGIIDARDKQVIGNPNPDLYGTITSKISLYRFTLNTIFTYSYGNDVYNYQRSQLESGSDLNNQSTVLLSRWTAENQITNQPKAVYGDPMGNSRFSDRWIEDGSYLRLKTLSLSYAVPIKSNFIEGLNIWISANNLLTFTKYLGSDPEFSTQNSVLYQGVDAGLVPLSKSYYIGLKLNL
jgi:TonB-linked SusC/RagA family outer membrane protein